MWRLGAAFGLLVWLTTIAASATINYLAGAQYGRTPIEIEVFALLGVAADVWKALGPLFIVALWRGRRRAPAILAGIVWAVCFAVAASAALGLAAQVRGANVGDRQGILSDYAAVERELADVEAQRASRSNLRSSREIESAIDQVLSRPIAGRGTVRGLSGSCEKDTVRTREACAEVADLRAEHEVARERERLDERALHLREERAALRERGAVGNAADPQAALIERVTFGWIAAADVGLGLTLLIGVMIELISAFAPLVIHEYVALHAPEDAPRRKAIATTARRKRQRKAKRTEAGIRSEVYDYLARRIRPDNLGRVPLGALFADYATWCAEAGRVALRRDAFLAAVERIAGDDLDGKIARDGDFYLGLTLETAPPAAE